MTLALVTGASRGIGRATALRLAERGVDLALLGRRSPELDAVIRTTSAKVSKARAFACDLAHPDEVASAAADVVAELGTPDAIIHNAGIVVRASIEDTSPDDWDRQLAVNLRAPFLLTRALLPAMRARRQGRIVHVASISSSIGSKNAAAYAASKWGMLGLMKSLAEELRDSGLMTVAILPGSVATSMLEGSGFEPRMTAEDVAATLVHYALDASVAHNGGIVEMFGT